MKTLRPRSRLHLAHVPALSLRRRSPYPVSPSGLGESANHLLTELPMPRESDPAIVRSGQDPKAIDSYRRQLVGRLRIRATGAWRCVAGVRAPPGPPGLKQMAETT